jgi:hypothetical protein
VSANLIADEGVQMGEMSKLGWLIELVKHAIHADSPVNPMHWFSWTWLNG